MEGGEEIEMGRQWLRLRLWLGKEEMVLVRGRKQGKEK